MLYIERHDVAHPRAVADLAHWLVDNAASLYSVNRLTGYLKSLGHEVDFIARMPDGSLRLGVCAVGNDATIG